MVTCEFQSHADVIPADVGAVYRLAWYIIFGDTDGKFCVSISQWWSGTAAVLYGFGFMSLFNHLFDNHFD